MKIDRRGGVPLCLLALLLALLFVVGMGVLASKTGATRNNSQAGWATLKIVGVANLPGNQATAVTDDGAIYFLEAKRGDKTSGQALYEGLKIGKDNQVHIASWMRRQNGRWLYVLDQMSDSQVPPAVELERH